VNPGAEANQRAANGRAEACWLVYLSLGPGRSLSRLKRTLTDLGLEISLNTLKGYSVRHGWSDRARFHDEAHAVDDGALATTDMASRQADMGTAMQSLAEHNLGRLLEQPDLQLTPTEISRLAEVGVRIERQARNADVTRHEVIHTVFNPFIAALGDLFLNVNGIVDEQTRLETWVERADALLLQHLPPELMEQSRGNSQA
jgi:hypothetical protein